MSIKRTFRLIISIILLLFTGLVAYAQFPYSEGFTPGSIGAKTVLGNSSTLIDGVLRLTNDQDFQSGYMYVDIPFSSSYGVKASFEYFAYGGTGADGFTFFLFDANIAASDFRIGSFGGSLGYEKRTIAPDPTIPGLKGAYMGVGFDEYGNFPIASEGKNAGLGNGSTLYPNSISIRGPESDNYKFLDGVTTTSAPLNFTIASGASRITNPASAGYRKVYIDLQPLAVGYTIVIKMDIGGAGTKTVLTANYPYPSPAALKLGFAASTGGSTNFHEIDNILIGVSDEAALINPVANADNIDMCDSEPDVTVLPLTNDVLKNDAPTYFDLTKLDLDAAVAGIQTTYTIAGKGMFTANANGSVTFTKLTGFTNDVAEVYYTIADNYNKISNQAKISVSVSGPVITVNSILQGCAQADLRTAITSNYAGLTMTYYKDNGSGGKVLKTVSEISNLTIADNGTYYIKATNSLGCESEKQVVVTVNTKPQAPVISLLP